MYLICDQLKFFRNYVQHHCWSCSKLCEHHQCAPNKLNPGVARLERWHVGWLRYCMASAGQVGTAPTTFLHLNSTGREVQNHLKLDDKRLQGDRVSCKPAIYIFHIFIMPIFVLSSTVFAVHKFVKEHLEDKSIPFHLCKFVCTSVCRYTNFKSSTFSII